MSIFSMKLFWRFLFLALLTLPILLYVLVHWETDHIPLRVLLNDGPLCPSFPEQPKQGPENQVSLQVLPAADRPRMVCSRVYNGRPDHIFYDWRSLRLERCWYGLVWSSVLYLRELLPKRERVLVNLPLNYVEGKSFVDFLLPSRYDRTPAGTYRVRFRYRLPEQDMEQTMYSEEFTLP